MPRDLRRHDEAGHAHFWTLTCYRRLTFFWSDDLKRVVLDGLRHLQTDFGVCLIGYVIMPEHVHVLLYPHERDRDDPIPISNLLHAFKRHVSHYGKEALRAYWRQHAALWSEPLNRWARGEFETRAVWFKRGYDFNVFRHRTLLEKLDYCHKNPITRGLVDRPEQWRWSSYCYYEMGDHSLLSMDWDGSWPIQW